MQALWYVKTSLFLEEIEYTEKNKLISSRKLNHHKYRFIALPIEFDFNIFTEENTIKKSISNVIIQYNGTTKALVV